MQAMPDLYCPVCGREVEQVNVWQEAGSNRVRIFCADCATRPEYDALPKQETLRLDLHGFRGFAAARQLRNAYGKEHPA